jgi:hypothetical protein
MLLRQAVHQSLLRNLFFEPVIVCAGLRKSGWLQNINNRHDSMFKEKRIMVFGVAGVNIEH